MKTALLAASLGFALSACGGGVVPLQYNLTPAEPAALPPSVTIIDGRPGEEKLTRVQEDQHMLILQYGDADFTPGRLEKLQAGLARELKGSERPVRIEITRMATTVTRMTMGTAMGTDAAKPASRWVVVRPDGSQTSQTARASVAGNVLGEAAINSEWFRALPSTRAGVSTLIQGTVNGERFLGIDSADVRVAELPETVSRVVEEAIRVAVRDIRRKSEAAAR